MSGKHFDHMDSCGEEFIEKIKLLLINYGNVNLSKTLTIDN